jgi:ElaB/YqjD/DUF883 family membrane-anchored ribosome-binding protein
MATTGKAAPKSEDIEAQVAQIREDIAKLTQLLGEVVGAKAEEAKGRASEGAEALIGRAKKRADDARHRVEDAATGIEQYIEERPIQSAMMALLAGIVIGLLTRR